jgi:hypothetical protein
MHPVLNPVAPLIHPESSLIMPTRRAAPTPEETAAAFVQVPNTGGLVTLPDDETDDDRIEENDIAARVRASLGGMPGDNVRVKLYRRGQFTRKLEWCEDFPPESVMNGADELIRSTWGAGAYELRVTGSTGTLAKIQIDIAAKPQSINANPAPAAPAAPAVSDTLAMILQSMADTQSRILEKLSAPPPPAAPALGMAEMLGMLATAKQLFVVPAPPPAAGIVEMAQQMRALKQLGEEFSPPAADPDSPLTMVNGLMGVIGEAIKARSAPQPPALPMPGVQLPSGFDTATEPDASASPNTAAPDNASEAMTRQYLEGLAQGVIQHVTENKPAQECAQWLAEALPPEFDPMLKLPNWLDLLCGAMPALSPHRDYLQQVKPLLDAEIARMD